MNAAIAGCARYRIETNIYSGRLDVEDTSKYHHRYNHIAHTFYRHIESTIFSHACTTIEYSLPSPARRPQADGWHSFRFLP